eukprot:739092-Rhodomonas_salina.7
MASQTTSEPKLVIRNSSAVNTSLLIWKIRTRYVPAPSIAYPVVLCSLWLRQFAWHSCLCDAEMEGWREGGNFRKVYLPFVVSAQLVQAPVLQMMGIVR